MCRWSKCVEIIKRRIKQRTLVIGGIKMDMAINDYGHVSMARYFFGPASTLFETV
jgi:hypothetical protein